MRLDLLMQLHRSKFQIYLLLTVIIFGTHNFFPQAFSAEKSPFPHIIRSDDQSIEIITTDTSNELGISEKRKIVKDFLNFWNEFEEKSFIPKDKEFKAKRSDWSLEINQNDETLYLVAKNSIGSELYFGSCKDGIPDCDQLNLHNITIPKSFNTKFNNHQNSKPLPSLASNSSENRILHNFEKALTTEGSIGFYSKDQNLEIEKDKFFKDMLYNFKEAYSSSNFIIEKDELVATLKKATNSNIYLEIENINTGIKYFHYLDKTNIENKHKALRKLSLPIDQVFGEEIAKEIEVLKKEFGGKSTPANDLRVKNQIKQWNDSSIQTLDEIVVLYNKLLGKWDDYKQAEGFSEKKFIDDVVKKDMVRIELEGIGVAELNMVDDSYFVRIVHYRTENSFGLFKDGEILPDSKHLKQYIARQHIDAGTSRRDGQNGRDFIMITIDDFVHHEKEEILNPDKFKRFNRHQAYSTLGWWKDYWIATVKGTDIQTVSFGSFWGVMQGVMGLGVGYLKKTINPDDPMDIYAPAKLSLIWGTVIGSFISTYKTWTYRGTEMSRAIKSASNGIIFNYVLMSTMLESGGDKLFRPWMVDDFGTFEAVTLHMGIWAASLFSNLAKPYWSNFSKIREQVGVSRGNDIKPFFGTNLIRWKRTAFEHQVAYLVPFVIRLLDRTNIVLASLPLGKMILIGSIPFAEWLVMKYTKYLVKKTNSAKAKEIYSRQIKRWNLKKRFFGLTEHKYRSLVIGRFLSFITFQKNRNAHYRKEMARLYPDDFQYKNVNGKNLKKREANEFSIPKSGTESKCNALLGSLNLKS